MHKKRFDLRSVVLLVLFVMILICSLLSFSYAYYSSSANDENNFVLQNASIECLNITVNTTTNYGNINVRPSFFTKIADAEVLNTAVINVDDIYTNETFGIITYGINNNCSNSVNFDILFVPDYDNDLSLDNVNISTCEGTMGCSEGTNCCAGSDNNYQTVYNLGNSSTCYTTSSAPTGFWNYIATTYSLDGTDQRMCSLLKQDYANGYTVAANSYAYLTVRYWIKEYASNFVNKDFAGRFVAYTVS